ncbi:hypothetical protein BDW22DRAFT_1481778, partial [Trametopsis cervina]
MLTCTIWSHSCMPKLFSIGKQLEQFTREAPEAENTSIDNYSVLNDVEKQWRARSRYLESRGYRLRPRFREDWIPSWTLPENNGRTPESFEDHIPLPWTTGIDATQISTGRTVWLKHVPVTHHDIWALSDPEDLHRHAVPLLDRFASEGDDERTYLVMPFLRAIYEPSFKTVGDVLGLVSQIME